MTTSTMNTIPLAIGAALAGLVARGGYWCAERMVRSPMGSTAFVLVAGLTMMGGTNALFFQETRHPAPMFSSAQSAPVPELISPPPVRPIIAEPEQQVAERVAVPEPTPRPATTQPEETAPEPATIGNADIAEVQQKLKDMGLFDGTVDGYYGPKTADAIRAFEQRHNLPRTGAASPQVIEAVRNAPINSSRADPVAPPAQVVAEPARNELDALISGLEADAVAMSEANAPGEPVADEVVTTEANLFDPTEAAPTQPNVPAALDRELVSEIQRGLSRLGFLQAPVDGVPGETTALAIRKFQVFNNFPATGEVSPAVRDMLVAAGAYL